MHIMLEWFEPINSDDASSARLISARPLHIYMKDERPESEPRTEMFCAKLPWEAHESMLMEMEASTSAGETFIQQFEIPESYDSTSPDDNPTLKGRLDMWRQRYPSLHMKGWESL